MTFISNISIGLTTAMLAALPNAGAALQPRFPAQIAEISAVCAQESRANSTMCLSQLLPYLSRLRAISKDLQYDTEIAALALAMVNAYEQIINITPQISQTVGAALMEVSKSAADPGQASQIRAIAQRILANQGLGNRLNRLLASPN